MPGKENLFWDALMEYKLEKKFFKKKRAKLPNAKELAVKYETSAADVEKVFAIFQMMDDDGSGTISSAEIANMLCGLGIDVSPKVVQAVMRNSDKSGDGEIDFEEFLAVVAAKSKPKQETEVEVTAGRSLPTEERFPPVIPRNEPPPRVESADVHCKQPWCNDVAKAGEKTSDDFITLCQTV
ncbi:unnamed protein product [Caenorhabditis auriculariae]|uniref:EF-hand domain-containing protein n=1 Tax=Caenorhabditis auriculariae TaxID=2777116 RepID=A0A8S1GZQ5_9PELO|nr:unnamed protein product [Caenorhabditis auriculariae]